MLRKMTALGGVAARRMSTASKIQCPPMVYIKGEEMTAYCMEVRRKHCSLMFCTACPNPNLRLSHVRA